MIWQKESNLNLLDSKSIKDMVMQIPSVGYWDILNIRLLGFISNLLIFIKVK
jgi:hypothetical protein